MEYDSKNILHFSHIDGSSHDIYQGFLELFFDYLGELIASVPLCVFSGRDAKSVNGY